MFEFNYNKYKRKEIIFDFPEKLSKTEKELNFSNKWEQLDSIFHKKKKRINFFDESFTPEETERNTITDKKYNIGNILTTKNYSNFNFQNLIHPIDDAFDNYIKEKIEVLDKLKINKYKQKNELLKNELLNNSKEFNKTNNFNFAISKYKKNESLIKVKNEPILILNKNRNNDKNYQYEINKMKTKKYFFSGSNENNNSDIGKRNKMRLSNILNKLKKETPNFEIINIPNKFNSLKKEKNQDYFDLLLEQINIKRNKIK